MSFYSSVEKKSSALEFEFTYIKLFPGSRRRTATTQTQNKTRQNYYAISTFYFTIEIEDTCLYSHTHKHQMRCTLYNTTLALFVFMKNVFFFLFHIL